MNDKINDLSAARYDGETVSSGDFSDEFALLAYKTIIQRLENSVTARTVENGICLDPLGLTVSCTLQRLGDHNGNYSAELVFILTHDYFDEPLCEYTAGYGPNADAAVVNAAEQFTSVVLLSVAAAFGCTGDHTVSSEYGGVNRVFRRSCTALVFKIGESNHEFRELFEIVEPQISNYLGAKKAYWIKLFAYRCGKDMEYEVRVNGAVMPDLSECLKDYVLTWRDDNVFHSEKQFVLLLDTDRTRRSAPVPPAKIIDITLKAIELFGNAYEREDAQAAFDKLRELCRGCGHLAYEIRALVPEIFTCALIGLKQGDGLRLMFGDTEVFIKKSQLRSYGYIELGVLRFLENGEPDNAFAINIMQLGSVMDAVNRAVEQGAKLENISLRELTLRVPPDYVML